MSKVALSPHLSQFKLQKDNRKESFTTLKGPCSVVDAESYLAEMLYCTDQKHLRC